MTAGELLIEQGRQRGREEGREESRRCLQELLLQQLRQRFGGQVDSHVEQRVAAASIEQVETWLRQVLLAASLGELFAN